MTEKLARGDLACDTFLYWQASLTTTGRADAVLPPPQRASRAEADTVLRRLRRRRRDRALGRAVDLELNAVIWRDVRRCLQARRRRAQGGWAGATGEGGSDAEIGRAIAALAADGRREPL